MEEDKTNPDNWTEEARANFVGFFKLLMEVDRRVNPELYKGAKPGEHRVFDKDENIITL